MPGDTALRLSKRQAFALLMGAFAPVAAASPASAATVSLRGRVTYRERMLLPPGSICDVKLLDVSLADARATVIAETRTLARTSPIRFRLAFSNRRILPGRTYALQARITHRGRLLFINTTRHTVFDGGPQRTDILVERVA